METGTFTAGNSGNEPTCVFLTFLDILTIYLMLHTFNYSSANGIIKKLTASGFKSIIIICTILQSLGVTKVPNKGSVHQSSALSNMPFTLSGINVSFSLCLSIMGE